MAGSGTEQLWYQGNDKPGKKASKHIHSDVERGISIVSRFTCLVCMLCMFPSKMSAQVLILQFFLYLQLLREKLVLREQVGQE